MVDGTTNLNSMTAVVPAVGCTVQNEKLWPQCDPPATHPARHSITFIIEKSEVPTINKRFELR